MFGFFRNLFSGFYGIFNRVVSGSTGVVLSGVLDIAKEVIKEFNGHNYSDLGNDQKRSAAVERIKGKALSRGVAIKDHAINLAIEMAIAELKK